MKTMVRWWVLFTVLLLTYVWVQQHNDYMIYRDIPVEFVDRSKTDKCHKTNCRNEFIGLFKMEDGYYFQQPIGFYTYSRMHLGDKFTLNLRPMDIKQTAKDNVLYFFAPVLLFSVTFTVFYVCVIGSVGAYLINKSLTRQYR